MSVNPVSKNSSMPNRVPMDKVGGKALTQDDFMKLFLAQMRTQIHTEAIDSGEMMQQMSQLTSLSATQELEKIDQDDEFNLDVHKWWRNTNYGKRVSIASEKITTRLWYGRQSTRAGWIVYFARIGHGCDD